MKAERIWETILSADALERMTGARVEGEWVAVAVPSVDRPALIMSAVVRDGSMWAFIDEREFMPAVAMVRAVKRFHAVLAATGWTTIRGLRDPDRATRRWMGWLGAVDTGETINGQEVWEWRR